MVQLNVVEARVLGCLVEKEITTPENYPLSLNALVNACNQKSSREPVMELSEAEVRTALFELDQLGLVRTIAESRATKFEHRVRDVLNLRRDEVAVMCLLLLRGAQTSAELRARGDQTAGPREVLRRRNWMPQESATSPMMPPRASISRTRWPLATPPIAGLQDIWAMRSRLRVKRAVRRPMRAAAAAASQPAWPAPTMRTSKVSEKLDAPELSEACGTTGFAGNSIWFDFSGFGAECRGELARLPWIVARCTTAAEPRAS
jgi:hypothetical protein